MMYWHATTKLEQFKTSFSLGVNTYMYIWCDNLINVDW